MHGMDTKIKTKTEITFGYVSSSLLNLKIHKAWYYSMFLALSYTCCLGEVGFYHLSWHYALSTMSGILMICLQGQAVGLLKYLEVSTCLKVKGTLTRSNSLATEFHQ
jgi:hypothetical protein